jgi:CRISPR-associated endonuclease/helicase Cas3
LDKERQHAEYEGKTRIIKPPNSSRSIASVVQDALEEDAPALHQAFQAVTRLGDPTVTIVCLWASDSGAAVVPGGSAISYSDVPDKELVEKLLRRAVTLSHRGVVTELLKNGRTPPGWKRSPWLRNHHAIAFDANGKCELGYYQLVSDNEIGVVIRRKINSPQTPLTTP